MHTAIFWRLVWKEYRQQRALWIAIALAGVIFQAAVLIYCALNGVSDLSNKLFTVALSVPILYSLGCGATLFAGEQEAGTFPFQQSLPVAAGRVFLAKFAFAALSALLLFPVLWLLAFAMASWELPDATWHLQLWGGGVVATVEVLIWAILGSLVLRRVLPAAVVSGLIAVLLGYSSLVAVMAFGGLYFPRQVDDYFLTLPLRSLCALIALVMAIKFGRQWFDEQAIRWRSTAARTTRSNAVTQRPATPATWITAVTRLVWHEWRQGRATMLWCVFGYVVLSGWLAIAQTDSMAFLGLLPVLATICGASLFAADQRQSQYEFFTEHGVRPRLVWLSRQTVWGSMLGIIGLSAVALQLLTWPVARHEWEAMGLLPGLAVVAFASGQLISILIRSGIVAVFTAAISSALLCGWMAFMQKLGVPWCLSTLPLPFIFLWSSWLYAPKWIQHRQTWRVRVVTAATILVPLCSVVAATAAYRVYEIPAITLSFFPTMPRSDDSPAARETAAMYEKASQLLGPRLTTNSTNDSMTISSRDSEWQQGIELFMAASQRESCHFYHWSDDGGGAPFDGRQLTRAVLAEAAARSEDGNLEGASELHQGLLRLVAHFYQQNYETWYRSYGVVVEQQLLAALPEWANHGALSAERARQALTDLQSWIADHHPDWESSILEHRRNVQRFIAAEDEIMSNFYGLQPTDRTAIKVLGTLLPWERWRMSRLLDVSTEAELQGLRELRDRAVRLPPRALQALQWDVRLDLGHGKQQLVRSTDVEAWLNTTPWLHMTSPLTAPHFFGWERQYLARRNAVQLQLGLIAWRKEHGELPDVLHKLIGLIGDPAEALPLDPYTDQPFVYFSDGVEEEIWDDLNPFGGMAMGGIAIGGDVVDSAGIGQGGSTATDLAPPKPRLVRTEPFLWSPGEQLQYAPQAAASRFASPAASDFRDLQGNPLTESDLLRLGVQYPIPAAKQQRPDSSEDANSLPNDE